VSEAAAAKGPAKVRPNRPEPVLKVSDLKTYLYTRWGVTKAVDGVSFEVCPGETLGIVGESGSGKSMLALSLVRLTPEPASRIESGQVILNGRDLLALSDKKMREVRGTEISMILQDPQQSLNPVFRIGNQLAEAIRVHDTDATRAEVYGRSISALESVHVPAPERRLRNYPHEISGGMRQRVVGRLSLAQVSKHFTGIALELTPTADFRPADDRRRVGLRDLLGPAEALHRQRHPQERHQEPGPAAGRHGAVPPPAGPQPAAPRAPGAGPARQPRQ
jgi:ABC-type antimicrobial peptide transport system ATPase subunit